MGGGGGLGALGPLSYFLPRVLLVFFGRSRGTPYNGLYVEAPPERGTSQSSFRYMKLMKGCTWGFRSWSIWKGREICHCDLWKDLKGLKDPFYGCEKVKETFWFSDLCPFKSSWKGQRSKLRMWNGYLLSIEGKQKGYLFSQKGCKRG